MNFANMFIAGGAVLASILRVEKKEPKKRIFSANNDSDESSIDTDDDLSVTEEEGDDSKYQLPPNVFILADARLYHDTGDPKNHLAEYYHYSPFNGSDIDIFLYALSEADAEKKIEEIYETFSKNMKKDKQRILGSLSEQYKDIAIIRTAQAVTFHFGYPIRPVQIILRIYKSPAEVLMGFDVDCCCVGYDGSDTWALPRAIRAITTRMNLIDVERQSTTYEIRLFKYSKRGFRVGVPGYNKQKVKNAAIKDLTSSITRRSRFYHHNHQSQFQKNLEKGQDFKMRHGLARLILLEKSISKIDGMNLINLNTNGDPNELEQIELDVADVDPAQYQQK
jgi:hypothetical protein